MKDESSLTNAEPLKTLVERGGKLCGLVRLSIRHIGKPAEATIQIADADPITTMLKTGSQDIEAACAASREGNGRGRRCDVGRQENRRSADNAQARAKVGRLSACRIRTTTSVTRNCSPTWSESSGKTSTWPWTLIRKTADYPPGAQFKWNTEVLWAVDSYLRQASPEKQQELIDAIRAGQVELDALYGNELTGLCRPEELLRLMRMGRDDRPSVAA